MTVVSRATMNKSYGNPLSFASGWSRQTFVLIIGTVVAILIMIDIWMEFENEGASLLLDGTMTTINTATNAMSPPLVHTTSGEESHQGVQLINGSDGFPEVNSDQPPVSLKFQSNEQEQNDQTANIWKTVEDGKGDVNKLVDGMEMEPYFEDRSKQSQETQEINQQMEASMSSNRQYADNRKMFFHHYKKGYAGFVILDMFMAHAYAFHENARYGGNCGPPQENKLKEYRTLLSAIGLNEVLPFACPYHFKDTTTQRMTVPSGNFRSQGVALFTPEYISFLKQSMTFPSSPLQEPNSHTIAVHIRRGNVTPCKAKKTQGYDRYLPNSHFQTLIDRYMKPNSRVLIFSQEPTFESFEAFTQKGYEVILDKEPEQIWATMSNSDVTILSRSDFSYIPGIIAKGTVVYTPFWTQPMNGWTVVEDSLLKASDAELQQLRKTCTEDTSTHNK